MRSRYKKNDIASSPDKKKHKSNMRKENFFFAIKSKFCRRVTHVARMKNLLAKFTVSRYVKYESSMEKKTYVQAKAIKVEEKRIKAYL